MSSNIDLQFDCNSVNVIPSGGYNVTVDVSEIDVDEIAQSVIEVLNEEQIILLFDDNDSLLSAIGIEECKKYFDLKEIE